MKVSLEKRLSSWKHKLQQCENTINDTQKWLNDIMYIAENKYFTINNTAKHSKNQTKVRRRKDN